SSPHFFNHGLAALVNSMWWPPASAKASTLNLGAETSAGTGSAGATLTARMDIATKMKTLCTNRACIPVVYLARHNFLGDSNPASILIRWLHPETIGPHSRTS